MSGGPERRRGRDAPGPTSPWDLGTPAEGAVALARLYGPGAYAAAADAAANALDDGRDADARFWAAARRHLRRPSPAR